MSTAKIAITIEESLLQRVDRLVKSKVFPNRSKAFQQAIGIRGTGITSPGSPLTISLRIPSGFPQ